MKKVLTSIAFIALIGVGISLVQVGCSKSDAQTNYVLPPATTTSLGGVIVGSGLSVNGTGVLSANSTSSTYTLPAASSSTLGGVMIGSGLTVNSSGLLSVDSSVGSVKQQNKIIYGIRPAGVASGNKNEIWVMNYDGTNQIKVNIAMPSGYDINFTSVPTISPDGTKVFFYSTTTDGYGDAIFSCNIDGTGLTKLVEKSINSGLTLRLGAAY